MRFEFDREEINSATIVGLGIALLGLAVVGFWFNLPSRLSATLEGRLLWGDLLKWLVTLVVVGIVFLWEKRGPESIGLRQFSGRNIKMAVILGVFAVYFAILTMGILYHFVAFDQPEAGRVLHDLPLALQLLLLTTAAVTEEVLYRGYAIERLMELTGSLPVAGMASGVVFLAAHYPAWGPAAAVPQGVFTAFLVGYYMSRRDLYGCIVMHWVINVMMLIIIPA